MIYPCDVPYDKLKNQKNLHIMYTHNVRCLAVNLIPYKTNESKIFVVTVHE